MKWDLHRENPSQTQHTHKKKRKKENEVKADLKEFIILCGQLHESDILVMYI